MALPALLAERRMPVNRLAKLVHVKQSHLSRALRGADGKRISGELASQIAVALGLPDDYFFETREARVINRLRGDQETIDRLYRAGPRPGG